MALDHKSNRTVQVLGIDAGGTMTDTFFVREDGRFVVGKAQSNPEDESLAIYNSSQDALAHWNRTVDDVYPDLRPALRAPAARSLSAHLSKLAGEGRVRADGARYVLVAD